MNTKLLKSIALTLMLAVTWTVSAQMCAEAMLVPAQAVPVPEGSKVDRSADIAVIQKSLESKLLREKLKGLGLNDQEIQSRLSKMSDQEVHQLAKQIRAVNPAGDAVVYILVVAVLVLLVIYLIKRV